jgi:uncharacterized protein YndB with AHSA1/START domain
MTLTLSRSFKATPAEVWDALTNPEKIKVYLFGTETISNWKAGSPIIFRGEWEGKAYEDKGTILEIEEEKLLKYNYWSSFTGLPDSPENYFIITYQLEFVGNSTQFTVIQGEFKSKEALDHFTHNWNSVMDTMKGMME